MAGWSKWLACARGQRALRDHLVAGGLCLPALIAVVELSNPPAFEAMLFGAGIPVLLHNLSVVVLIPYLACFLVALGDLLLPGSSTSSGPGSRADVVIVNFFGGAALLVVLGFVLALFGALHPEITAMTFFLVLYLYFIKHPGESWNAAKSACGWLLIRDPAFRRSDSRAAPLLIPAILLRAAVLAVLAVVVVVRGTYIDVHISDIVQLYLPYLDEVRRQHGMWLDPAHPVYSDFLVGRGNGAHLFLTSFTNSYATQAISVTYVLAAILLVRQATTRVLLELSPRADQHAYAVIMSDVVALLSLSVFLNPALTLAKYHMQTTALMLGLTYILSLVGDEVRGNGRAVACLVLIVLAIPTTLPQYQAFATLALVVGAATIALKSWTRTERSADLRRLAKLVTALFLAGCVVSVGGLLFNWAYIGVPELNPYWFFARFINHEVFSRWTSREALEYTSHIQHIHPGFINAHQGFSAISTWRVSGISDFVNATAASAILGVALLSWTDRPGWEQPGTTGFLQHMEIVCLSLAIGVLILIFAQHPSLKWIRFSINALYSLALASVMAYPFFVTRARQAKTPVNLMQRLPADGLGLVLLLLVTIAVTRYFGYPSFTRLEGYLHVLVPLVFLLTVIALWRLVDYAHSALSPMRVSGSPAGLLVFRRFGVLVFVGVLLCSLLLSNRRLGLGPDIMAAHLLALVAGAVVAARFWLRYRHDPECFTRIGHRALMAAVLVAIVSSVLFAGQRMAKNETLAAIPYVIGLQNRVATMEDPNWDFSRCLELRNAVPAQARVLHLNGYLRMSQCLFNPLLPRGTLVHHYQSGFARRFGEIVFGAAGSSEAELRKLGINYFLVDKDDVFFWGPGLSELFSRENLVRHFQIFYESPQLVVLTWRGQGYRSVSKELADDIERWREVIRSRAGRPLTPEFPFDLWGAIQLMREERARSGARQEQ